jgi:hypothetical protein
VTSLLDEGISPAAGGRRVMIGSLFGGTGVSTLTALIERAWSAHRVPSVAMDATGHWRPGLPERIAPTRLVASPRWADIEGRSVAREFEAVWASSRGRSVLIGAGERCRHVDPETVAAVAADVSASWPLVLIDVGSGAERVREHLQAGLLVLVCRSSAVEIRQSAEFLREAHRDGLVDGHQAAVITTVGGPGRQSTDVSAAMAAVSDIAAGAVRLPMCRTLARRETRVDDSCVGDAARLLAAAVAAAPG